MQLYIVWDSRSIGVNEKCLLREDGNYIGVDTGNLYNTNDGYYASKIFKAKIKNVDDVNKTGMYHLYSNWNGNSEENNKSIKQKYVDCFITVRQAHWADGIRVYQCLELDEYFSEDEIEILE